MAFTSGGIDVTENATAACNEALYAANRLRERLGYAIGQANARDLDIIDSALIRIQDLYLSDIRAALQAAFVERSGR